MHDLPTAWIPLCITVFVLGMRHGFDPDHLATIDGLTRISHSDKRRFARYCGALFSAGHGSVVITIAAIVGALSAQWTPPGWINLTGAWISIAFLLMLGAVNLRAAAIAPEGAVVPVVGIKRSLVARATRVRSPWAVAGVGALFALSFDTLSQAALFALTASRFGGVARSLEIGALFLTGMLVSDGLNGLYLAHLLNRADRVAAGASRIMSVVVGLASLLVGALGACRLLLPSSVEWSDGHELLLGSGVLALTGAGYLVARCCQRSAKDGELIASAGRLRA